MNSFEGRGIINPLKCELQELPAEKGAKRRHSPRERSPAAREGIARTTAPRPLLGERHPQARPAGQRRGAAAEAQPAGREGPARYLLGDAVQDLVHLHAGGVPVVAEADDDHAVLLREDGLVHLPAVVQVREHVRHGDPSARRRPRPGAREGPARWWAQPAPHSAAPAAPGHRRNPVPPAPASSAGTAAARNLWARTYRRRAC